MNSPVDGGPMCEHFDSSLLTVHFPAQASEGIRDLRHLQRGAALYQLSLSMLGELYGHPGGKSFLPPSQGLRWMMMEWLIVLSRCHCHRRCHCALLSLLCLTSRPTLNLYAQNSNSTCLNQHRWYHRNRRCRCRCQG